MTTAVPAPASITICGALEPATIAALVQLALTTGAALLVQARPPLAPAPLLVEAHVERVPSRPVRKPARRPAKTGRRPVAGRARSATPVDAGRGPAPNRDGARELRWRILQALKAANEAGLGFGALLSTDAAVRRALDYVGAEKDKRVTALRNALTILRVGGLIDRSVGQWVLSEQGRARARDGKDAGAL